MALMPRDRPRLTARDYDAFRTIEKPPWNSLAEVRSGSVASHPDVRDAPGMSATPPTATRSVRRNEASRCAKTGCEQSQQTAQLFDHLVGAGEQRWRDFEGERF